MNEKEDCAWVFDSLVGFLQGPVWSAPLLTFIEEKSLIFEADAGDNPEYHKLYQEYKNLVDLLLGSFMDDMGITPEQFEHACTVNKNVKIPIQFQQSLFEQIWAANEYRIFERMMIQKNLELQLQALNVIEQKFGLTPASLIYDSDELEGNALVMEELMHERSWDDSEGKDLVVTLPGSTMLDEHERLVTEYQNERTMFQKTLETTAGTYEEPSTTKNFPADPPEESPPSDSAPLRTRKTLDDSTTPLAPIAAKKREDDAEKKSTSDEEVKKRQEYLKARRDKLVALKKEARSQQLKTEGAARPSSAKIIAEATMKGQQQEIQANESVDPSILQVRKALAARLRAEVVQK